MKLRLFDVTVSLHSGVPVWPGDPPAMIERVASIKNGDGYNGSRINSSLHWGTHIDAPFHVNPRGWTIDQIPLEILVGEVQVMEFSDCSQITAADIEEKYIAGVERLLFKTRNSEWWSEIPLRFHENFTSLTKEAAEFLIETNVKLVGIDYLSIDLYKEESLPVHHILYQRNVVGIEGLDLSSISPGKYEMYCLPMRIAKGDGAPARVVLKTID